MESIDNKIIQLSDQYCVGESQRTIEQVSVVKCWEKFGMNVRKVNKFLEKAGLNIQLNEELYGNVLVAVLNGTVGLLENLISKECLLELDLSML